jgi:hypothetical protein
MNPDGVNIFTALRGMQGQLEMLILALLAVRELTENETDRYHLDNCLASVRDAATELRIIRGE